jgi:4a-hydroxytetrahydrobiopterin dehydratase
MAKLVQQKCVPCEGGTPPLEREKIDEYMKELDGDWKLQDTKIIARRFEFKTFPEAIDFVNRVATLAEQEDHHPDIIIRYNKVTLELSTHAIGGLSDNDFIVAAKVDLLYKWEEKVEKAVVRKLLTIKVLLILVVALSLLLLWKKLF